MTLNIPVSHMTHNVT